MMVEMLLSVICLCMMIFSIEILLFVLISVLDCLICINFSKMSKTSLNIYCILWMIVLCFLVKSF